MMDLVIFELQCDAVNHAWGKLGKKSIVTDFLEPTSIQSNIPYAELWIGIHPTKPSHILWNDKKVLLSDILKHIPTLLGTYVQKKYGTLPFLLKVLSIAQPLSIQAHPDKELAKQLHQSQPKHYSDTNHKPEIAIAQGKLSLLLGFESFDTSLSLLNRFSIFQTHSRVQSILKSTDRTNLQKYSDLIHLFFEFSLEKIQITLQTIANEIASFPYKTKKDLIFLDQLKLYPTDIGLLMIYFMEYREMDSEEAVFLKPNQLHAYLQGNLIECMANSDNVIRAGMTNKFKDIKTLQSILPASDQTIHTITPTLSDQGILKYITGAEEFELFSLQLAFQETYFFFSQNTPQILLILKGAGKVEIDQRTIDIQQGKVFFIGANQDFKINCIEPLKLFIAQVPIV